MLDFLLQSEFSVLFKGQKAILKQKNQGGTEIWNLLTMPGALFANTAKQK